MSKATKRKHVTKEVQQECLTLPKETESIVQVILSKGNNLHEVMDAAGEHYLVSMPVKFRKNIWVMRGNYVLVEAIPEGDKVKAEIVKILTKVNKSFILLYLSLLRNNFYFYFSFRITSSIFEDKIVGQKNLIKSYRRCRTERYPSKMKTIYRRVKTRTIYL